MDPKEHQELGQFLTGNVFPPEIMLSKDSCHDKSNFRRKASNYRIQEGTKLFKVCICSCILI